MFQLAVISQWVKTQQQRGLGKEKFQLAVISQWVKTSLKFQTTFLLFQLAVISQWVKTLKGTGVSQELVLVGCYFLVG